MLDNFSPHRTTRTDQNVGDWAAANNVELAYVPFHGSWLNRIEAQFTALRYFALDGTDRNSYAEQASTIRRYIACRNRHAATHPRLREVIANAETDHRRPSSGCSRLVLPVRLVVRGSTAQRSRKRTSPAWGTTKVCGSASKAARSTVAGSR